MPAGQLYCDLAFDDRREVIEDFFKTPSEVRPIKAAETFFRKTALHRCVVDEQNLASIRQSSN